jgi:hypothetical protein
MPPRTKLSTGASGASKAITALITVALTVIAAFTALASYGFAYGTREVILSTADNGVYHRDANGKLVPGPSDPQLDSTGIVGGLIGGVVALLILWFAFYLLLRALRRGAWLEGTVLHVRGAMRRKSANLATGHVSLRGQTLTAGQVSVPTTLPQEEVLMLANAIGNNRSKGDNGLAVAEKLRGMARDPFS